MLYRCPKPPVWADVHKELLRHFEESSAGQAVNTPPTPLILAGWVFSSASAKHQRWLETVEWAREYGCPEIVSRVAESEFVTWDYDEGPYHPTLDTDEFIDAVNAGDVDQLRKLLNDGVDTDGTGSDNNCALEIAVREEYDEVAALLVSVPRILSTQGRKALSFAALTGRSFYVGLFLNVGVACDEPDQNGWTPLTCAAYGGNLTAVEILVDSGAEIDHRDGAGMTPLIQAACVGADGVVEYLLRRGADRSLRDSDDLTAEQRARDNSHESAVAILASL